jgi:hypothetical protein
MKTRRFLMVTGGPAAVLAAFAFAIFQPQSPINEDNFDRIEVGMELKTVENILGLPPGDYTTRPLISEHWMYFLEGRKRGRQWISDTGIINVYFGESWQVASKAYFAVKRKSGNPIAKVCRWLGL